MKKIVLPIDTKSLHYNIKNDNKSRHTATVSTPLKQGSSYRKELGKIYSIPHNISIQSENGLIEQLISSSRSKVRISDVFVFDKISVNGITVDTDVSFCIYLREETDSHNIHCGRIKVHYPITLKYEDSETVIDNRKVINAISNCLHNYAFLIKAFEYDFDKESLNFIAIIVGENLVPYSKVFVNERGTGNKFTSVFNEIADVYDMEIISMRQNIGRYISPSNFPEIMQVNKEKAIKLTESILKDKGFKDIINVGEEYPYSLFDFQYNDNGITKYLIVCFTSTKSKYFNLSVKKVTFCNDFHDHVKVLLITDINGNPLINEYTFLEFSALPKRINSIMYIDGDEKYE